MGKSLCKCWANERYLSLFQTFSTMWVIPPLHRCHYFQNIFKCSLPHSPFALLFRPDLRQFSERWFDIPHNSCYIIFLKYSSIFKICVDLCLNDSLISCNLVSLYYLFIKFYSMNVCCSWFCSNTAISFFSSDDDKAKLLLGEVSHCQIICFSQTLRQLNLKPFFTVCPTYNVE